MSKIKHLFRFAYTNAYDLKRQYSNVKTYNAGGNIAARWYVYFSYRNPETGKLKRQPSIDTGVNIHKNVFDRTKALENLKKAIELALKNGYNPYDLTPEEKDNQKHTITEAFELIRTHGKRVLKDTSYPDFKSRINQFENWVKEQGYSQINQVTKKTVIRYLKVVLEKSSMSNRNNTKANLSMGFGYLVDDEIIPHNFIKDIAGKKTVPVMHQKYSASQEAAIFERLEKLDPELGLFIEFVSFNFLRPIEVCRLLVSSIDLQNKLLVFAAKNQAVKTKIIPEVLFNKIPELAGCDPKANLFSPNGIAVWDAQEINKRGYWTNRFKKVIKDHFNYGVEYSIYSFRHTLITRLYNNFLKEMTPNEAKSKLMLITGHKTQTALEKYLRDIDAVLPDDYSEYLK